MYRVNTVLCTKSLIFPVLYQGTQYELEAHCSEAMEHHLDIVTEHTASMELALAESQDRLQVGVGAYPRSVMQLQFPASSS